MTYITVEAAALILGISGRRVRALAAIKRIRGAKLLNPRCWMIPNPPVIIPRRSGRPKK